MVAINNRNDLYGPNAIYKNHNLFIEASAGAGKTETIINMIVDQLYDGVSPEKIVAITFTNKATEELLNRINSIVSNKINELQKNASENRDKIDILSNALNNLYKMNVSTIHHFCNVILNKNSYKAKISFNATLLEENDEENRRDKYYYEWLHSLNKNEINKISNCNIKGSNRKEVPPFNALKSTYDALCDQFDDIKVDKTVSFSYTSDFKNKLDDLFNSLKAFYDEIKKYSAISEISADANKLISLVEEKYNQGTWGTKEAYEDYVETSIISTDKKAEKINIKYKNGQMLDKAGVDKANDDIEKSKKVCRKAYDEFKGIYEIENKLEEKYNAIKDYSIINEYAEKAWNVYKYNRDRESLCNNQLIYETYKLIKENNDVKEKIAKQYDIIFVDEFQDTDKYQNMFIMSLALAIDERKRNDGKLTKSIVLVGDPKQSIYGFRGADFDLFMKTKNNFYNIGLNNSENILLPDNYRSNQFILEWINDTYRDKNFYSGYQYNNMIMPKENVIPTTNINDILAGVYSYDFNQKDNKFLAYASLVKSIKENKKIYKKNGKVESFTPEEIKYSDFLILTTSHTEINQFIMAFNKLNIKTNVAGEFDLSSSIAINYLYRMIEYIIAAENNDKKLLGKDFNSVINDANIKDLKDKTKELSPFGKVLYIFNNFDLIFNEFEDSDKELLKNIIAQICENIGYNKNASSILILENLDKLIHNVQDAEISLEPNEDAVRIMNIHKAKGLTSEIVIIADSGSFKNDSGCKVFKDTIYLNNMELYPGIIEDYKEYKSKEKLRLEYVASTRAKQVMIFESDPKNKQLFKREEELYNINELEKYHIESSLPEVENKEENELLAKEVLKNGINTVDSSLSSLLYKESNPSSLDKQHSVSNANIEYRRPTNDVFGTMFHRVMELHTINRDTNIDLIIYKALKENETLFSINELDRYKNSLKECFDAVNKLYDVNGLFESYNIIEPEYKFCDYDGKIYGNIPTLMTGSIDLLLIGDNKSLIIDYKTNKNNLNTTIEFEEYLKNKYQNQLDSYKKFINKKYNIAINNIETKIVWLEEKEKETIAHFLIIK